MKADFFARLKLRHEDQAVWVLPNGQVPKGNGKVDWQTFAETAMAVLEQ